MEPNPAQPQRWFIRLFVALGIATTTAIVFAPAASYGLVNWDDPLYVGSNRNVRGGLTVDGAVEAFARVWAEYWIPMTWLSFQLDVTVFGDGPGGFPHHEHRPPRRERGTVVPRPPPPGPEPPLRCAAVALLWAVHPLRVRVRSLGDRTQGRPERFFSDSWASGAYTRYAESRSEVWMAVVFVLFALGMMAKPALITFPCCLLLLDAWPLNRLRRARDLLPLIREKAPLFILVIAFGFATTYAQQETISSLTERPVSSRARTALVGYALYLSKTVWPDEVGRVPPVPAGTAAALAAGWGGRSARHPDRRGDRVAAPGAVSAGGMVVVPRGAVPDLRPLPDGPPRVRGAVHVLAAHRVAVRGRVPDR